MLRHPPRSAIQVADCLHCVDADTCVECSKGKHFIKGKGCVDTYTIFVFGGQS